MFYSDTADQLVFLITVCFSFSMFISALWFKNANVFPRLLGISFLIPMLIQTASFLTNIQPVFVTLSWLAEYALLLFIFILIIVRPGNKHFGLSVFLIPIYSFIWIILANKLVILQKFVTVPQNRLLPLIILLLMNLYFLKKENGAKGYLFWALLSFVAGSAIACYINYGFVAWLNPLLKMAAYILFTIYFYKEYFHDLIQKTEEFEKKITRIDRNLDMEVKKRMMEIERAHQNLVNISKIDSLSKALNKAAILDAIENLISTRQKSEFSILMFDIDNFKQINDTLGHVAGDKCIKSLSVTAKTNLREFDMIGRYGGDEFIIVLPGTNTFQAVQIAERFREKVEMTETPHYTISIGIASYPKDGTTVKEIIEAADEGLYKSKANGRNAVTYRD